MGISALALSQPEPLQTLRTRLLGAHGSFLPTLTPVVDIPSVFDDYLAACEALPGRYHAPNADVRPWLDEAFERSPALAMSKLQALSPAERDTLMLRVSVLAHAYRWISVPPRREAYALQAVTLPRGLAEPWAWLAKQYDIPRVGNLYTMVLCNWRHAVLPPGVPYHVDDVRGELLRVGHGWLQSPQDSELHAFLSVGIETEARGTHAITAVCHAIEAALANDTLRLHHHLEQLEHHLGEMAQPFKRYIQRKRIAPQSFMTLIQPTTIWNLDEGNGPLEGASGPQVGAFQVVDALLDVGHESAMGHAILRSRAYMPWWHRAFIDAVEQLAPAVRRAVVAARCPALSRQFDACAHAMLAWRRMHRQRGAFYLHAEGAEVPGYASTGHVVSLSDDRVRVFETTMDGRLAETRDTQVGERLPG